MDCMDKPDEGKESCKLLYEHTSGEGMRGQEVPFFASSDSPALLSAPHNLAHFQAALLGTYTSAR